MLMESGEARRWKQISLLASIQAGGPVSLDEKDAKPILEGVDCLQSTRTSLVQHEQRSVWEENIRSHLILTPKNVTEDLERFREALALALIHIIERWRGTSESSNTLSYRMPLMCQEEELIQWMHRITKEGHMPLFRARAGHWRPDIILSTSKKLGLSFHVCEINASFISMMIAFSLQMFGALFAKTVNVPGISAADPEVLAATFCSMFEPNTPLYLVRKRHEPSDIGLLLSLLEAWTGIQVRVITPDKLQPVPDLTSFMGYRLCAHNSGSDDEELEQVHQAALDLYQDELRSMNPDVLRHLALCSVNDIREAFLLADKRILGIVLQELDDLVLKHGVLTPEQAILPRHHIVPTILPGSPELDQLISDCQAGKATKDNFLVKACRNGGSENILFGDEYALEEWEALISDMKDTQVYPNKLQFVIQPNVRSKFKEYLNEERGVCDVHLVGLYHSFRAKFSHLGYWRVSPDNRLCSSEQGGTVFVLPSVTESESDD